MSTQTIDLPRSWAARIKNALPRGRSIPEGTWSKRHRGIRILLVAQSIGLFLFGLSRGYPVRHSFIEAAGIASLALMSGFRPAGRTTQTAVATLGLMFSAALLVHLSGGSIEAHFSFFVMLSVIALYQDWTAFLLAIAFVAIHHGLMGALQPASVYNHPAAQAHPWTWAGIHAAFVLGASIANLVFWRVTEAAHEQESISASLLSATLDSTADGILVVDSAGKITNLNQRFLEMWRIPEDVIASHDDDAAIAFVLDQLADPTAFLEKVRQLYAEPEQESFDVLHFKDGRAFERFSRPQRVDDVAVGRVWSFRDVTERNKLDEMKDGFLSAVSHELRTPLTTVLGCAATMQQRADILSNDERNELVDRLTNNARKLQRLVADILDLDRLGRGMLDARRAPCDVTALIRGVVDNAEFPTQMRIKLDIEPVCADIDAPKTERIVENLLLNAARHTPPGTPVLVRTFREDDALVIVVDDAGPGVPDDLKESIFGSFQQGNTSPHSPGVGIGLALVARFAEIHGGSAWVEDRAGGGSSFRVRLPATVVPLEHSSTAGASVA